MQLPHWTRAGAKKRRRAISSAERRRRDELLIPLEVSQLEKRRVLSGFTFNIAPVLTASGAGLTPIPANISSASNSGNLVSSLVSATSDTGKLGIAITATNNGGSSGTWQYSTDGTTWVNIGTVSSTSALLLDGADYVRFVPGTPYTGSASITFCAWDESDGSNLSKVSVTSNGGTTAFSSTTTMSSIAIYSTLTISGTGTASILDDQTTSPFDNGAVDATISDSSTSDLLTITITQQLTGGATDSTLADGSLSGGGFTNNSDGTYTLSGVTVAAATADLQALIFTPSRGTPTVAVKTTFQIQVSDSFGAANSQTDSGTVVTVTGNTMPTLGAVPPFAPIPENSTSATVNGTQISTLIAGLTNNANDGIAITGVDNSNGQWEWSSTNVPGSWTDLSGDSPTSALLLSQTDYLRFVPNAGFVGSANIEFVAWDMSVGSLHSTFDTTAYPGSGGFSSPSVTDTINVEPVISIGGTGTSYSLTSDTPAPFSLATISDSDSSDTVTITITQQFSNGETDVSFADGTLSSPDATFTSSANGVYTLANIPIASAQTDLEAMTFTPAAGVPGTSLTTKFGIVVSDDFGSDNSASDDGTTLVMASPPLLIGVTNFADIPAGTTSASQEVSTLIDANPSTSGVAVVAVDDSNGTWQYSPDGTNWSAIPTTVSASSAFLLASNDEVRFVSDTGVANTAMLTLLAWNGADGTAGSTFDATAQSTAGDFSTNAEAVAITVFPVLSIGGTGTVDSSYGQTPNPFAGVTLSDTATSESVTVTITQLNTGGVDTTLADGSLSGTGLIANSGSGAGTYALTAASVADAQADLQSLEFSPTAGTAGASVTTSFQIQISDSSAPTNTFTTIPANDQILVVKSPSVLNGANPLPAEDANTVAGTEVSALIYNPSQVTDPSDGTLGIAVIGLTDNTPADGQWQYSTAAEPTDWLALPTSPSTTSAFLLANTDLVRFVPATSFVGTPSMTFLAWDGSAGTAASVDTTYNATTPASLGAFSAASATSSITVAPVLSISGTGTVDSSLGQTITPFETVALGDSSTSDTVTITITQIVAGATDTTLADGSLSSSGPTLAESNGVYSLSGISASDAQADLRALTFTPVAGTPGASLTTSFRIELSDGFDPTNTVITSASGTPNNEVLVVKSPPILSGANQMSPEDATTVAGTQISALIYNPSQVTDPSDTTLGIAVVGLTDNTPADGQWQYSTAADPTDWLALPTSPSATAAFLLANTDFVRYVPATSFVGTPTLTFLAWDDSAGTAASVDATYNATTPATLGAFSAANATTSIAVRPVLSIAGTGATSINDDQQTTPFDNGLVLATVGDTNTGETVTVTIVQEIDGAGGSVTLDSTLADGLLTGASLTTNTGGGPTGAGTYSLTGTAAAVTAELQALVFTPNAATVGQTVGTTFEIVLGDGPGLATTKTDSNTQVGTLSIASPTLTGTNNLQPLPENVSSANDAGIEVSDLPTAGSSSNIGIAVSNVEDTISGMSGPVTIGTWEYSTDGTAANPTWNVISGVSSSSVLLLAPTDYIRFLPAAGYVGSSTISFQAWNQFSGTADTQADATQALLQRGLSTNTATASVEIAPVLAIGGTHASASLDDQTSLPFSGATISDSDPADPVTITITQIDVATMMTDSGLANGSLTSSDGFSGFSYNAGTGAYTLTADNAADAQTELRLLVFAPTLHEVAAGQTIKTEFKLQLADSGFGTSNTRTDTTSVLTVTADATPQLNGANNLTPIPENDSSANDAGVTVASLISGGKATDSDGDSLGIAITGVETKVNTDIIGEWDYSTDGGTSWTAITAVSSTSALLLAPTDLVRFLPAPGYFGTATIQFQAWDQTVGSSTQTIDPTTLPGAGAFSTATATASIQVVAPATITATTPSQSTTDESTIDLFAAAFGSQPGVADPNTPAQTYTITVTQQLAGGATDTALANGSLAGGGFVNNGNGTYTLSGVSAAAATADLEALVFTPTAHEIVPGDSITTDFTITVNDGVNVPVSTSAALGNEVNVSVTADIDPPTFDSVQTSPINFPVLAATGTVVGSDPASDVDHLSTIVYSITGGNASGIYAINPATGQITVANNAALSYLSSLTQLQVTAINTGDHGVASNPVTSTFSIALWEITASATPIAADSSTTLTLTLLSAAPSAVAPLSPAQFTIAPMTVDWSDGTTSTTSLSLAQPTVSLVHFYFANPNKANPSASIPINVEFSAVGEQFSVQTLATVDGTGIGFVVIPNNATAFVELAPPPTLDAAPATGVFDTPVTESIDTGVAQSQTLVGSDRRFVLRIISAHDTEGSDILLPDKDLNDLPGLFRKLPDGHYRVYLSEDGHERLVIDVIVRQGRPVDSSEDLHGTGDRPPTSQTESHDPKRFVDADPRESKTQIVAMRRGIALLSTAAGSAALATVDGRRRRIDQLMSILSKRSLSKGARLSRKFKRPDRVE